jgi:hypothetical protein
MVLGPTGFSLPLVIAPILLALLLVSPRRDGRPVGRGPKFAAVLVLVWVGAGYLFAFAWPYLFAVFVLRGMTPDTTAPSAVEPCDLSSSLLLTGHPSDSCCGDPHGSRLRCKC